MKFVRSAWATSAELVLFVIIVCYGSFSVVSLILLLLLGSQSLWIRGQGWLDLGLRRPAAPWRTVIVAGAASVALLVAIRTAIVPLAVSIAGEPVDLSALGETGDTRGLLMLVAEALTVSAFGEEMVFRGYLMRRIMDLVGDTGRWPRIGCRRQRCTFRTRASVPRMGRGDRDGNNRGGIGDALPISPQEFVGRGSLSRDCRCRIVVGSVSRPRFGVLSITTGACLRGVAVGRRHYRRSGFSRLARQRHLNGNAT